jgi:hypothetical protein
MNCPGIFQKLICEFQSLNDEQMCNIITRSLKFNKSPPRPDAQMWSETVCEFIARHLHAGLEAMIISTQKLPIGIINWVGQGNKQGEGLLYPMSNMRNDKRI